MSGASRRSLQNGLWQWILLPRCFIFEFRADFGLMMSCLEGTAKDVIADRCGMTAGFGCKPDIQTIKPVWQQRRTLR